MSIYNFTVLDRNNNEVSLEDFKGKVLLIVNTATECGFTPQYEYLQELYTKYNEKGLVILDFPCNQFGNQAPGSAEEIYEFCTSRFGVTFPQMAKIEVNGENASEVYKFLTSNTKFGGFDMNHKLGPVLDEIYLKEDPEYFNKPSIKWNFTKFLFDREGNLIKRFEPTAEKEEVDEAISKLL
ncbi:MAG: glutathione peroxidase [Erysipelotrichaceae bacterium]|nr:glutathione peroxidase [Erysipelotrichaceae bacterium]